jgi:hypothetical protein
MCRHFTPAPLYPIERDRGSGTQQGRRAERIALLIGGGASWKIVGGGGGKRNCEYHRSGERKFQEARHGISSFLDSRGYKSRVFGDL